MAPRTASLLVAILTIATALAVAAPASAAKNSRRHVKCPIARRGSHARRRARICRARAAKRHRIQHGAIVHPRRETSSGTVNSGLVVGLVSGSDGWGGASTAPRLDQVTSQTGAKWLREEIDWSQIESQQGVFDFSYYDHFMLLAAQRGIHVLAMLYDTPSWAGAASSTIPSDPTAFGQFVAAIVARYGTNGSFWNQYPSLRAYAVQTWEIWNEPYAGNGNNGHYDPGAYARLVKAAAVAGRSADPNAKFLMAAEMQSALTNGAWQWWTDAMYQAVPDLNNYFDAVAVHDYGNDTTTLNPIVPGQPYHNYG